MNNFDSQLKAILFFTGNVFRWPAQKPMEFLYLHAYILLIRFFDSLIDSYSVNGLGFMLTIAILAPLFIAINRGLPLDCLDYHAELDRELGRSSPDSLNV